MPSTNPSPRVLSVRLRLQGLGATLVLLSVFRKALPALPISIGLGVVFYVLTRLLIIPYIANLASFPFYV